VLDFFYACGVLVLEGYGLTESSTAVSLNDPEDFRLGTVGRPLEGTEIVIAEEDGEVLVRGPQVFRVYWNDEEATGEVLDEEGWLRTGDVGSFDEDGFLSITGRKKDILVTSSGENVPAPAIEARIAASRWVSNAVVYGNDKNYVVALVTIDEDERDALGEETGTRQQNRDLMARQMTEDDNVRLEIQEAVDEANRDLAQVLQVKKFAILDHDLAQQEDEITPTMKIKRDVVYERYRDVFEGLYENDEEQ
jgi:long-chain acyl-CoA synthetase